MFRFQQLLRIALLLGLTPFLSGCEMAVLDPKGIIAAAEKHLLVEAVLLMLIIVIPTMIISVVIAIKFRASNTKAKYTPDWGHSTVMEIVWWTIPIIIIAILATVTWISSHQLDPYRPLDVKGKPLTIQVISLNWRWLFIYPDQKIAAINFIEIPVNTPVTFLITSDAPMNSFDIPQLAGQIYAMAGMQTKLHIMATENGTYQGLSTNFSGNGFSNMTFTVHVTSQEAFNKWVKVIKKLSPNKLTKETYNQLVPDSEDDTIKFYSTVQNNLFNDVMMKYMMPM